MTYQPLANRILVRVDQPNDKTASGLVFVQAWKDADRTGVVEATGSGIKDLEVGQHILFNPYAALPVGDPDEHLVVIKNVDILATV